MSPPPTVGDKRRCFVDICPAIRPLSTCLLSVPFSIRPFAWCDICTQRRNFNEAWNKYSSCGWTGHCWKGSQGQSSKVKVISVIVCELWYYNSHLYSLEGAISCVQMHNFNSAASRPTCMSCFAMCFAQEKEPWLKLQPSLTGLLRTVQSFVANNCLM